MTSKRPMGLLEAMQNARKDGAMGPASQPAPADAGGAAAGEAGQGSPGPMRLSEMMAGSGPRNPHYAVQLTQRAAFGAILVIVLALLAALWWGYHLGRSGRWSQDRNVTPIAAAETATPQKQIVDRTGPARLERRTFSYRPGAEVAGAAGGAEVRSAARGVGSSGERSAESPREEAIATLDGAGLPASDSPVMEIGGSWRIRILHKAPAERSILQKAQQFLAEKGIPTVEEKVGTYYIMYSKKSYQSPRDVRLEAALTELKSAGKEFAKQVNRRNEDFSDAYAVKIRP